ncbi:MAG: hypothetical protein ACJ8ER_07230 [Allosphingosinicella sp.]
MKRRLRTPPLGDDALDALSAQARHQPYAKHKRNPRAFGLEPIPGISDDPTYCDEHAGFTPDDMKRVPGLIKRGIVAGLTSEAEAKGVPRLLWSIDDNGWVYEARLTNEGQALYHGYPLLPGDPVAIKVISRFRDWAYARDSAVITQRLAMTVQAAITLADAAQGRYGR